MTSNNSTTDRLRADVPDPDTERGWTELTVRIEADRRRRRRIGLSALVAMVAACIGVVGLTRWPDSEVGVTTDSATSQPAVDGETPTSGVPVEDSWSVKVDAELDAVDVRSSSLDQSEASSSWRGHTLVFTNTGRELVTVEQFDRSEFLGDRELYVGIRFCRGLTIGSGGGLAPSPGVCNLPDGTLHLQPGSSVELPVEVWRDLEGMNPVSKNEYETEIELTYQLGDGPTRKATLRLRYEAP